MKVSSCTCIVCFVCICLQDDLVNDIVLPLLSHVDEDINIRKFSVEILLDLAQNCRPQNFLEIINIVEKVTKQASFSVLF